MNNDELVFWLLMLSLSTVGPVLLCLGFYKNRAEAKELISGAVNVWARWSKWTLGQRLFMVALAVAWGGLTLIAIRLGVWFANWAAITYGGMPVNAVTETVPLGSWRNTALLLFGAQFMLFAYLEFKRVYIKK